MTEDLPQSHGAQDIPQGGGSKEPGRAAVVVHIGHGVDGICHSVVHDGVDKHCHRVFGQDLEQLMLDAIELLSSINNT